MGGEEHDAGVEGPAELGHRGYTFLNDPTPGSAAEFAQEEGSLRLRKPIANDVTGSVTPVRTGWSTTSTCWRSAARAAARMVAAVPRSRA